MEYEKTQTIATLEHVTHCVEYLRQVSPARYMSITPDRVCHILTNNILRLSCVALIWHLRSHRLLRMTNSLAQVAGMQSTGVETGRRCMVSLIPIGFVSFDEDLFCIFTHEIRVEDSCH